jgi:hypothetical protein
MPLNDETLLTIGARPRFSGVAPIESYEVSGNGAVWPFIHAPEMDI